MFIYYMNEVLLAIDYKIFVLLNNFGGKSYFSDWIFLFLADAIIYLIIAGLALFVLLDKGSIRLRATIEALVSGFIGMTVFTRLLRGLFFRERPFVQFSVEQLLFVNPFLASYPSGHATIMFAISTSIFLYNKIWGIIFIVMALISSISRVIAGVHFPSDIVGGVLVGVFSAILVWLITHFLPLRWNRR